MQAILFTVIFLLLSAFMVAISFHVYRFRYPHDNTSVVFIALTIIYILVTVMTYLLFDYSPQHQSSTPTNVSNTAL